jgi:hypothetical protein
MGLTAKFLLFGVVSLLNAQSAGTFAPTAGNLNTGRFGHTATLLPNGKVLIAGGQHSTPMPLDHYNLLASAELYDPLTGMFTPTGSMNTYRAGHTATLLANGKVLIAGGAYSNVAELYDPATETFSPTGDMITQRTGGHSATLLNDGRVLIAGGSLGASYRLANAELYDPSTGTFAATGDLPAAFARAVETLLPSGKVFIDGSPLDGSESGAAALYDPAVGSFATTGTRLGSVCYPTVARLLPSGKVLELTAGVSVNFTEYNCFYQIEDPVQLYDPATGTFTLTGQIPAGCTEGGPDAYLGDGLVMFSWGDSVEFYDPSGAAFACSGPMASPSHGHTSSTLLADGTVLLAGGQDVVGNSAGATAEVYAPPTPVSAPVLLSVPGSEQAAILHASTQALVSSDSPAAAGEILEIYLTGLLDGSVIPPQVAIGGKMAEVLFFGKARGYVGLNQVNVRVPSGIASGTAAQVWLNYLGRPSNQVATAVQ